MFKIVYYDMDEMKIIRKEYEESAFTRGFTDFNFYEYRGK